MPFECSKFFDKSYNFYFSSVGLNKIFKSPFNSSILLTITILFIIILYFPSKKNTPLYILCKIGLYIFICNYIVLFLHSCIIKNIKKTKDSNLDIYNDGENIINNAAQNNNIKPYLGGREIIGGDSYDIDDGDINEDTDIISDDADDYIIDGDKPNDDGDNLFSLYGV